MNTSLLPVVALVIGHGGIKKDPGALSLCETVSELDYNTRLVARVHAKLEADGKVSPVTVHRRTYGELPGDINALNPKLIQSFHCNSNDTLATGSEFLHYHSSKNGKRFAQLLGEEVHAALGLVLRGDKGAKGRTAADRGGSLLAKTKAPCVISEPFFINNPQDLARGIEQIDALAQACVNAIYRYFDLA